MKINMTAPVISDSPVNNEGQYEVLFVMPKKTYNEFIAKASFKQCNY